MIVVESTLTKAEYIKISYFLLFRKWSFCFFMGTALLLILLSVIIGNIEMLITALAFLIFILLVYSIAIIYAAFSSKNRNFFLPMRYVFIDNGVSQESSMSHSTMKWTAFVKWRKIAGYYLLYISKEHFVAIPRSEIPVDSVSELENLISSKITGK
jgi:hypothetical protein